jgi:Protein of unknown function (DUF3641)
MTFNATVCAGTCRHSYAHRGNFLPIVRSLPKIWVVVSLNMEPGEINTGWPNWSSAQPKKGLRDSVDRSKPTTKSLLDARPTMPDNRKTMRPPGCLSSMRSLQQTGLWLNLVYNSRWVSLLPPQAVLVQDYRRHLYENHEIILNHLNCLTNMLITRFEKFFRTMGRYEQYQELLASAFNPDTLDRLKGRDLLSAGWGGWVYACDFTQMLDLPLRSHAGRAVKIGKLSAAMVESLPIQVSDHSYACTDGAGSSCGGALLA